ncbi:MAG: DUF1592 domain-containing protein [Sandaracinaceae bacterium]
MAIFAGTAERESGRRWALAVLLVAGCQVAGCQGVYESPGPTEPPITERFTDFECHEGMVGKDLPARRLSRIQHRNTVESVLSRFYDRGTVAGIMDSLAPQLATRPVDQLVDHPSTPGQRLFGRSDQSLSEELVRADLRIAEGVAAEMTASDARIEAWAGACATNGDPSDDAACLDAIVDTLGPLTHRRPLTDDERAFYRDEAYIDGDTIVVEGLRELVTVFFAQPSFVFHLEGEGPLNAYEAAARLSYHFWNSMPDDALMAAAEDGSLMTDEGWSTEVSRVLADPRAESSMRELLDEWLKLDRVVNLSGGTGAAYDMLRGDLVIDDALDRAVRDEVGELFVYLVRHGGTFRDFFLSDMTVTQSPELAALYGMTPSADGSPVAVPDERVGILTRAGMLLPRSDITPPGPGPRTHPILRGVFVRRQIMCDVINPPPAGAMNGLAPVDQATTSTRDGNEIITGSEFCGSCHHALNAAGYALEEFDPLGRHRTMEQLFDPDGNPTIEVPVDASAQLVGIEGTIDGGSELSARLYETELPSACFSRHYVRFALGRPEDPRGAESCVLRSIDEAIDEDRPLSEVLGLVVLDPAFRVRTLEVAP